MKTREHDWFDTKTLKPKFGIQVFAHGKWMNAAEDNKPCLYDTKAERDTKRAEFRRMPAIGREVGK